MKVDQLYKEISPKELYVTLDNILLLYAQYVVCDTNICGDRSVADQLHCLRTLRDMLGQCADNTVST